MDYIREYVEIELSPGESTQIGDMIATVTEVGGENVSILIEKLPEETSSATRAGISASRI